MVNASVVDSLLSRYGFEWHTKPYRVVDKASQKVIAVGPQFNFSEEALENMRRLFDKREARLFKKS
jgi:hypothetical protein